MSVNKRQPHVFVLPEDDANRQIATGFLLELDQAVFTRIQVLEEAGGWVKVLNSFETVHVAAMNRYPDRFMVLLFDFDGHEERRCLAEARVPVNLKERVFILGALSEPEALKRAGLGSYETIGMKLAKDCHAETMTTWKHDLLRHNTEEIGRLSERVRTSFSRPSERR